MGACDVAGAKADRLLGLPVVGPRGCKTKTNKTGTAGKTPRPPASSERHCGLLVEEDPALHMNMSRIPAPNLRPSCRKCGPEHAVSPIRRLLQRQLLKDQEVKHYMMASTQQLSYSLNAPFSERPSRYQQNIFINESTKNCLFQDSIPAPTPSHLRSRGEPGSAGRSHHFGLPRHPSRLSHQVVLGNIILSVQRTRQFPMAFFVCRGDLDSFV